MATFDAKIVTPPDPIEAAIVVPAAIVTNATSVAATPHVFIEPRASIVRRSVRQ